MIKKIGIILFILLFTAFCKEEFRATPVPFGGLKEKSIEITSTKKFEGFLVGASFERNEVYVQCLAPKTGQYALQIIDLPAKKVKKEMKLKVGAFESPTECFNPSYMQFLENNYIIVDQYHKILVYDQNLNYLYTNMFHNLRYFIDFYSHEKKMFFVIGMMMNGIETSNNSIEIFRFPQKARPQHERDLHVFGFESLAVKDRQDRKYIHLGSFWPSGKGFHKNEKIYYANYNEQQYYVYDIKANKTVVYGLNFLAPKIYSQAEADKLAFYGSDGWEERIFNRDGTRVVAEAYSKPIYHFGIFNVGVSKIGIIGDLDMQRFQFRLDVLDASSGSYLESLRLPFGNAFTQSISTSARGLNPTYINVDKGYYLWNNVDGEDVIDYAHITTFMIKAGSATGKQ